jgi:ribonuclease Z
MKKITMLGTGNALATRYYNTCFVVQQDDTLLMVDAGGGNQIFNQLQRAGISLSGIHHLFLTHAHTDHVLGAVWVARKIMQEMKSGAYDGTLHVYGNEKVTGVLEGICRNTLPAKLTALLGSRVLIHRLSDGEAFDIGPWHLHCFDILSTKEPQFGFRIDFPDGTSMACLGDEPYNERNRRWVEHADWMLAEAFCRHDDADRFHPYEKHHSTALDAARLADSLGVPNLVLYHTEDKTDNRKANYTAEAQSAYHGRVCVPDDLEVIDMDQ